MPSLTRTAARAAALLSLLVLSPVVAADAADTWIFASFSKNKAGETTWIDEAALPSRDRCLEFLNAAVDADAGILPLVGVKVSRTQNTVVGTDPKTRRTVLLTIYSCRPG